MRVVPTAVFAMLLAVVAPLACAEEPLPPVKVGETTIQFPAAWQRQPPANRLRLAQFQIPPVTGDQQPAELSIFAFGAGGTVAQQVRRWQSQFESAGRKFQGRQGKSKLGEYVLVELSGTYKKPDGPPVRRRTVPMPGARMLIMMVAVKGHGNYFFKLVGPEQTVAQNSAAFRKTLGATDEELPLELDER